MKKLLCFLLCLTLIFSSISLSFAADASWSTTDSQNLQNAAGRLYYMNNSAAYYLYNIATNTQNTYNKLVDIYNALFYGNHNITYWVNAISTWMSPIYQSIVTIPTDLTSIRQALWKPLDNDSQQSYLSILESFFSNKGLNGNNISLFSPTWDWGLSNITFTPYEDQLKNLLYFDVQQYNGFVNAMSQLLKYTNHSRYYTDWATLTRTQMSNYSFGDGVLNFLDKIQQPVARLSYVLASDERIEAQEAAAANEEAVVDNFIDSSGSGAASTSDIGSVSDLSSGYKQNFGSDASVSGIFNIFDSNNMGWFSQETKNQLDTTPSTRLIKGSVSETPLLDKQIKEIYDALGVKQP